MKSRLPLPPVFLGFVFCCLCLLAASSRAEVQLSTQAPWQELGGASFSCWSGLQLEANGEAVLRVGESARFRYPEGPVGWRRQGFRDFNDSSFDWRGYYGVRCELLLPEGRDFELKAGILSPLTGARQEMLAVSQATLGVAGTGWRSVLLPLAAFDFEKGRPAFLEFVSELRLSGRFLDGRPGAVRLRNVRLVRAPGIALTAEVRGKALRPGEQADYEVRVGNASDTAQRVTLKLEEEGWERLPATVSPESLMLEPGASALVRVQVRMPAEGVPAGAHEKRRLQAFAGVLPVATLELVTARDIERPSILLTKLEWAGVRAKAEKYPWARAQADEYSKSADSWTVPQAARPPNNIASGHVYVFRNEEFLRLHRATLAWLVGGKMEHARKLAQFLVRLADPKTGYPSALAGTDLGEPQEGGNFQTVAIAYDAIRDAGVLSADDKRSIEAMMRVYLETIETPLGTGNVGNWNVAASTSGLFCALALGDLAAAERYLHGTDSFDDFLSKGVMDDGWWWECSTSYNLWVAAELTQCALACRPWGIDLLHQQYPVSLSPRTVIAPWALHPIMGMSFDKWGSVRRNNRTLKQLWDAIPTASDYRGFVFGINDGHEEPVGSRMELGYFAFRDPAYVPLLKLNPRRDLVYGVPELPETEAKPYLDSVLCENLGVALLRSQNPARPPRERIAATFKIGTQGGYHGHFDRVSLNSLSRYGRGFWNPESIWWGYGNYLYKFYVQTSVAHNMVVVDQRQQEAVPSSQLLFYPGRLLQVSAQETVARWADAPYGGMEYSAADSGGALKGFGAGMRRHRQSVPLAEGLRQGELGAFGEPVLQRRVGIVTDDYVLLADYLKGNEAHVFDNLLQLRGFLGLEASAKTAMPHRAQFSDDPRSSAQFITDCDWYRVKAPTVARFLVQSSEGDPNQHNENGVLKMDVHALWPREQELMLAQPPESLGGAQWIAYELKADGKVLAAGESGVWVLGGIKIDVPLSGARELELTLRTDAAGKKDSLFLVCASLLDASGGEQAFKGQVSFENVRKPAQAGADYYGGPIKVSGVPCSDALPAQPEDASKPAVLRLSLAGSGAVRFKALLGGDYPFGDESARRRVLSLRCRGTAVRYLTLLEPYEGASAVKKAEALDANHVRVELADGRVQTISLENLEGEGSKLSVTLSQTNPDGSQETETAAATSAP